MATITVSQYFDDNARTAGEAWTINNGAELTIRTDTRVHANAPASMTGSHGAITINEGKCIIDATNVRWLIYKEGTGNVPAIGTAITQGATTGYLLGVWASFDAAPTAVSDPMPVTGYLKFREVTGVYTGGALTGIGATADGNDVAGWIEVVGDSAANIVVPRLGEFRTRGNWFELPQTTNGSVGQVIQIPTNGGGADTYGVGLWIETAVGSGQYRHWPAIKPVTEGNWHVKDLGGPYSATDRRCEFVKNIGNGQMQIGEASDLVGTYEALSQSGTYETLSPTGTYTWAGDKVVITITAGHLLRDGEKTYVDFTSGDAVADGVYTIKMLDLYSFEIDLVGSGAGGNVTLRTSVKIVIANHNLGVGDKVYCDFSSGSGVSGEYTIRAVVSTAALYIDYTPTGSVLGNVTVWAEYRIHTSVANRLHAGNQVYLDFTSGAGTNGVYTTVTPWSALDETGNATYIWASNVVTITLANHAKRVGDSVFLDFTSGGAIAYDGVYVVDSVTSTSVFTVVLAGSGASGNVTYYSTSFRINAHDVGLADSGNVTVKRTIGHVPVNGLKIRIPNVIMRECATATRANNIVHNTITTRPEFVTTSAGEIDLEYAYSTWWFGFLQPYSVRIHNSSTLDRLYIEKLNTPIDIDNVHVSTYLGVALNNFYFFNIKNGGTVKNMKCHRGGSDNSTHSATMTRVYNVVFTNCEFGNISKYKSNGYPLNISYSDNITFNNCRLISQFYGVSSCTNLYWNNYDYCSSFIGKTNWHYITLGSYAEFSTNIIFDGFTCGYNGEIPDVGPYNCLIYQGSTINSSIRNIGSKANPLVCTTFRPNYFGCSYIAYLAGNNLNLRVQNVYLDQIRNIPFFYANFDKKVKFEKVYAGYYTEAAFEQQLTTVNMIECIVKGCRMGRSSLVGHASAYGTHFNDYYYGDVSGALMLHFNEPTTTTSSQFTILSGAPRFNGSGGLLMATIGDEITFEDTVFRIGHTGFLNTAPVMSGGTIGNYTMEYDIDIGSGYSGGWSALTGANLSAIVIDPAIGFKMKYHITTTTGNTTAMTYLEVRTTSSAAAQANEYPLELYTLTLTGLQAGTKIAFKKTGTEILMDDIQTAVAGSVVFTFPNDLVSEGIDIIILAPGYSYQKIVNYVLQDDNLEIPISQIVDYGYDPDAIADVTFNGPTKLITVDTGITTIDVVGVYNKWITWALTGQNLQYLAAFSEIGGNDIDVVAGTTIPVYVYLINGWRIKPDEANHMLAVTTGIILVDGGGDPFVDTVGAFTVRVKYQQPVQAITVGGATPTELAAAVWDALVASHVDVGSFGKLAQDPVTLAAVEHTGAVIPKVKTVDVSLVNL